MAGSANSIQTHNVLRGRLSEDNVIAGTVGTGYNPTYALVGEAAAQIVLYINSSDYKMYAELKDKNGNHIMNSNIIDLPLETMVVNGNYDSETREVVLILDNGNELRFSVADLVRGLVSEEDLTTTLRDYVKFTDYATSSTAGVVKTGKGIYMSSGVLTGSVYDYANYQQRANDFFISKGTLENVITGKQLVNKTYVDEADEVFEEDLFGDASIIDSGESIILNNTIEKAPLSITLKGNTYQDSTSGKNLFDTTLYGTKTSNGITLTTNEDGTYTLNGTSTVGGYTDFNLRDAFSIVGTGEEIVSANVISGTADKLVEFQLCQTSFFNPLYINVKNSTGNPTYRELVNGNTYTTTTLRIGGNCVCNNLRFSIQVEKGTTPTSFEKYTGGQASPNPDYPQEIEVVTGNNVVNVCGKNLFDENNQQQIVINNVTGTKRYGIIVNAPNKKVSISGNFAADITYRLITNDVYSSYTQITQNTTVDVTEKICIYVGGAGIKLSDQVRNLQIEISDTPTTYEAYKGQNYEVNLGSIELCKIGTYQDRIYKNNGNWYLHKEIGKVVLDGSEDWNTNQYAYVINNIINAKPFSSIADVMAYSNYFLWGNGDVSINAISFWYNFAGTGLRFIDGNSNLNNFKTWLSTHNTIVNYVLQTPTDTQITDTTLVNQLNALYNATSYDTQTNINQVNANLPFILDISTFKNTTKGKIEALEQEDENYEKLSNKVIELSSSSTDTEYPSAKCVYNLIGNIESILETLDIGNGV